MNVPIRPRLTGLIARFTTVAGALLRRGLGALASSGPLFTGLLASVIALLAVYFTLLGRIQPASPGTEVSLDRISRYAATGQVARATLYDEDSRVVVRTQPGRVVYSAYPKSDARTADLIKELTEGGARVEVDPQSGKARTRFVVQFLLPMMILAALFGLVFMLITGKGGAADFAAFSKFRGARRRPDQSTKFADVAGNREAIVELTEVVDFLRDPGRFSQIGARAPKGVLLAGPPGTGKTLLARAVAGEAAVPIFSISGSQFVESLVGVGAARVRDLFRQAREQAPAIIFIDELDAAGRQRGAGMGQGNDEREQTLNQILVEMDGFSASAGVCVLAATNRPDILDPALLRPGRFDRQVVVDPPDAEARVEILRLYLDGRPVAADVDLDRIARQTPGFTGADIANLVNEAALMAVRASGTRIANANLEAAVDRVVAGPERRSHALTDDERLLVAYHEAGHAVVAKGVGMATGVQKLSIVARARSLGHTTTYQLSDRLVLRASELRQQLVTLVGGAAVEQVVFGEVSTGCEHDLRSATALARAMVATYGMGTALGRVAVGQKSGEVFLGRDFTKMQEVSPATLEAVDGEVRDVMDAAEAKAAQIVVHNRTVVEAVVARLLVDETLSGPDLDELLADVRDPAEVPRRRGASAKVAAAR